MLDESVYGIARTESKARLAKAIKELRGDRSQRYLAEILGVGQATVQLWEAQTGGFPTLINIEKIAKLRNEYPEQFLAYLYGREIEIKKT